MPPEKKHLNQIMTPRCKSSALQKTQLQFCALPKTRVFGNISKGNINLHKLILLFPRFS